MDVHIDARRSGEWPSRRLPSSTYVCIQIYNIHIYIYSDLSRYIYILSIYIYIYISVYLYKGGPNGTPHDLAPNGQGGHQLRCVPLWFI